MTVGIPARGFEPPIAAGSGEVAALQYAALCYRITRKGVFVLLVTSRDTGRWLMPKGRPITGLTPAQTAAREAQEEGGVRGEVVEECLGHVTSLKTFSDRPSQPCRVAVYPLRVKRLAPRYPEMNQRQRKWVPLAEAADLLQEPEAAALLDAFAKHPLLQGKRHRRGKG